jgi:hypothetical protein
MVGPIRGRFIILDPGDNVRSDSLQALVNRATDADEVLRVLRKDHPACVNVVNAHVLAPEDAETGGACSPDNVAGEGATPYRVDVRTQLSGSDPARGGAWWQSA